MFTLAVLALICASTIDRSFFLPCRVETPSLFAQDFLAIALSDVNNFDTIDRCMIILLTVNTHAFLKLNFCCKLITFLLLSFCFDLLSWSLSLSPVCNGLPLTHCRKASTRSPNTHFFPFLVSSDQICTNPHWLIQHCRTLPETMLGHVPTGCHRNCGS